MAEGGSTDYRHVDLAAEFIKTADMTTTTARTVLKYVENKVNHRLHPAQIAEVLNFIDHHVTCALLPPFTLVIDPPYVYPNDAPEVAVGYCERLQDESTSIEVKLTFLLGLSTLYLDASGIRLCKGVATLRGLLAAEDKRLVKLAQTVLVSWGKILEKDLKMETE